MTGEKARETLGLYQELGFPVHGFEVGKGASVNRLLQAWDETGKNIMEDRTDGENCLPEFQPGGPLGVPGRKCL